MTPKTYIFIGQSGCGKGTQVDLLEKYLREVDSATPILRIKTGDSFRAFVASDSYSSSLSKKTMESGVLQPNFLAVWLWADLLVKQMTGGEHLLIDGSPRSLSEAQVLDSALDFYGRQNVTIIHLHMPKDVARERLILRGRADDVDTGEIDKRLSWFEKDVVPAIEFYRNHDKHIFIELDGVPSIEEIHQELIKQISDQTQN